MDLAGGTSPELIRPRDPIAFYRDLIAFYRDLIAF
jgi:hypothetical protein